MNRSSLGRDTAGAAGGASPLRPPPLVFEGKRWPAEALARTAGAWRDRLAPRVAGPDPLLAMVMANRPESVALFFALSSFPVPLVLLPRDLESWRSTPPLPPRTLLVLLDHQRDLEGEARALGLEVAILPGAGEPWRASESLAFMALPGIVLFTSGSTGRPRPVYRSTAAIVKVARALVSALGLGPGDGVIASLPLARAFGLNYGLMAATVLGSPLALLDRFEHTALLRLFATGAYRLWAGTPTMADVLGRCALPDPVSAPPRCVAGGRTSAAIAQRFRERFGVSLRQGYGTTETATIAVDTAPEDEVRADTAGLPLTGVALRIGDDARHPLPPGAAGRIWLSAPDYLMAGYGFPPDLEPPATVDGWWGTPDIGSLAGDGRLSVSGRLDDCFRTHAGYVVDPAAVTGALEQFPGVVDAAVVPLTSRAGHVLGVLVESAAPLGTDALRRHLAQLLPPWSQPRVIETIDALPRLPSGRIDRRGCIELLERSLGGGHAG